MYRCVQVQFFSDYLLIMEPNSHSGPRIKIIEQPTQSIRFRYVNEGRNGGPVVGSNSTMEQKTFVRIQLVNYTGRAIVVVSCVSHEGPRFRQEER